MVWKTSSDTRGLSWWVEEKRGLVLPSLQDLLSGEGKKRERLGMPPAVAQTQWTRACMGTGRWAGWDLRVQAHCRMADSVFDSLQFYGPLQLTAFWICK